MHRPSSIRVSGKGGNGVGGEEIAIQIHAPGASNGKYRWVRIASVREGETWAVTTYLPTDLLGTYLGGVVEKSYIERESQA